LSAYGSRRAAMGRSLGLRVGKLAVWLGYQLARYPEKLEFCKPETQLQFFEISEMLKN